MSELVPGSAFVTGGGSGIGRAIALALAERGAAVAVMDLREDAAAAVAAAIVTKGGRAIAGGGDVSRWDDVDRAVSKLVAELGPLGIIVNAAGVLDAYQPADETSPELWERVIAINLTGTFFGCKRALVEMLPAGSGRMINIASVAGLAGDGGGAAYVASKHGVVGLTRRLATSYGGRGITTNAICPGPIETDLRLNSMAILGPGAPDMTNARMSLERIRALLPVGRRGSPEEVAAAACFLSAQDTGFINGLMLTVDGGWTAQ
ncbi:MAG TPA: SDR family oxidoreductase [Chloroflexota bacterium]|nr:SDR family oxidoreductase [Chloroflexota bacterium]